MSMSPCTITRGSRVRARIALFLKVLGFFFGAWALFLGLPLDASAHTPHICPDGLADKPVLKGHLSQDDIISGKYSFEELFTAGETLFTANFNTCDGQGRPATTGAGDKREADEPEFSRISAPDANSCAGCHNQPRAGGGGDIVANVFVLAQTLDPVTESTSPQFSNSRNTLGMMGSGAIEMLAREMTTDLIAIRKAAIREAQASNTILVKSLDTKGIHFGTITAFPDGKLDTSGIEGVDSTLIIKPFHQAGVVISLREFTVNAMNHHHGMQAEERFDLNPTKGIDFDEDGIPQELSIGDITAATLYQAALGVPGQMLPASEKGQASVRLGEALFETIGCASCHVPEMTLDSRFFVEPNPYNAPGTWNDASKSFAFDMTTTGEGPYLERAGEGALVRAYTDLKRHDLCDDLTGPNPIRHFCNEKLAQNRPEQDGKPGTEFFLTRKLWDVGNSTPYGHGGDLTTIAEAILAHGGEARATRDAFVALPMDQQYAIVDFLKTLQVLPPGSPQVVVEGRAYNSDANMLSPAPTNAAAMKVIVPFGLLMIGLLFAGIVIGRKSGGGA